MEAVLSVLVSSLHLIIASNCDFTAVFVSLRNDVGMVWEPSDIQTSNESAMRCVVQCYRNREDCQAVAVTDNQHCVLLRSKVHHSRNVWTNPNQEWKIYVEGSISVELPVFRVSAGSGVSVRNAWENGPSSTLSDTITTQALNLSESLSSGNYYRHSLLDTWEQWNITQINVTLYTKSNKALELLFRAEDSSVTSWFSKENLISSPWTDLASSQPNYFTFSHEITHDRIFYINSYFSGCPSNYGWLVLLDRGDVCAWANHPPFPSFRYAHGTTMQNWESGDIRSADDFVVYVRLQI